MQELPNVIHSTPCQKNSLYIPLKFIISPHTMKVVKTTTIIDSTAQINCIDWDFICQNKIPTKPLTHPFPIHNTDQTSNIICWYEAVVYIQLGNVTQKIHFYIITALCKSQWNVNFEKSHLRDCQARTQLQLSQMQHWVHCSSVRPNCHLLACLTTNLQVFILTGIMPLQLLLLYTHHSNSHRRARALLSNDKRSPSRPRSYFFSQWRQLSWVSGKYFGQAWSDSI